jgi:MoxR-like ATPase
LSHGGRNKTQTKANNNDDEICVNHTELLAIQQAVMDVSVSNEVLEYIIALCHVTRNGYSDKSLGKQHKNNVNKTRAQAADTAGDISCNPLSPRASKALLSAAKAMAFIDNRDYVLPDDVQAVFYVVCQHRLEQGGDQRFNNNGQAVNSIAQQILNRVDVLNPLGY